MGTLVDNLLLLSQADDGAITVVRREVDLDDVVEGEARRLRQLSPLAVRLDSTPVRVVGDEHQLQQVVRNLLDNAARHATTEVVITLTTEDERAVLRVEDDGPGIRPADRERVFERFVRLDAARSRDDGGAGLGLAIARDIAVRHGGTLTAQEAPTGGALFELHLPPARSGG